MSISSCLLRDSLREFCRPLNSHVDTFASEFLQVDRGRYTRGFEGYAELCQVPECTELDSELEDFVKYILFVYCCCLFVCLCCQVFVQDNQGGAETTVIQYLGLFGSPLDTTNMKEFKRVSIIHETKYLLEVTYSSISITNLPF